MKNIGKVQVDLQFYSGEDYYTEGIVEDEILEYVKNAPEDDYNNYIEQRQNWSVLYHLSHLRQNIVASLDISDRDDVLEIGAGCGAITGKLCEMAGEVTCIELSKKRSMINAYRNRDKDNLRIIVGNFETIEKSIDRKYDIITLIGVLEYAASYISTDDPYHDFIRIAMSHLKDGGKLVVAIENRLGLKYFAGCKEDHLGMYFEGIEGYTNTNGVVTFSREELEQLFGECGYDKIRFRYPYPDYKFPFMIYSDDYLPKPGELNLNLLNMDQERQVLFDESKFYDSISASKLFPVFSNSFLIEVTK